LLFRWNTQRRIAESRSSGSLSSSCSDDERSRRNGDRHSDDRRRRSLGSAAASPHTEEPYYAPFSRAILSPSDPVDVATIEEGARCARHMLAIYTWMLYCHRYPLSGTARLVGRCLRRKLGCGGGGTTTRTSCDEYEPCADVEGGGGGGDGGVATGVEEMRRETIVGDNFLGVHEATMLAHAGLDRSDVAYASFEAGGFYETPYCVVVDRERNSVVLSIRGSLTLEDCVVDVLLDPCPLDALGEEHGFDGTGQRCHGGVLECAQWLHEDLMRCVVGGGGGARACGMGGGRAFSHRKCCAIERCCWKERFPRRITDLEHSKRRVAVRAEVEESFGLARRRKGTIICSSDGAGSSPFAPWLSSDVMADASFSCFRCMVLSPKLLTRFSLVLGRSRGRTRRHKTLQKLLLGDGAPFPDYTLRIVGHSLGAGIGVILSLMLRGTFPNLRCICYSPPGGLLTWDLARRCSEFVTSFVLDSDIVPRLSLDNMERLRDEVLHLIARVKLSKYEIARRIFWHGVCGEAELGDLDFLIQQNEDMLYPHDAVPDSDFVRQLQRFDAAQRERRSIRGAARAVSLYPPGDIVHLVKTGQSERCLHGLAGCLTCFASNAGSQYTPMRKENDDFNEIEISPTLWTDHFPDRVCVEMERMADRFGLDTTLGSPPDCG
ncbi:hypothetical protein ACHAWF_005927, partial [Thalassiosira exigua]